MTHSAQTIIPTNRHKGLGLSRIERERERETERDRERQRQRHRERERERETEITSCNTCDICQNYMVFSSTFVCTVTGKKYYIRGNFTCNSTTVIYLVECINCKCQYVGSATSFKQRFHIH